MGLLENISQNDNFILTFAKKTFALITNPKTLKECKKNSSGKIYLLLTPQYNNLGDHAIAISSLQFLEKIYPTKPIIEITSNFYKNCKKDFQECVTNEDILFIIGGGFMGDMWETLENLTRDIVKTFPNNKIVFLPQTIFYGNKENIAEARNIYSKHTNLIALLRDEASYNLCKNELAIAQSYFVPDAVTNINLSIPEKNRINIAACLREDCEKIDNGVTFDMIKEIAKTKFNCNVTPISTLIKKPFISPAKREKYVKAKIGQIAEHKLLITNRLHAMLFAYISKTPCLAMDNKSKKVSGTLEWLSGCSYIKMYSPDIDLYTQMSELMNLSPVPAVDGNEKVKETFAKAEELFKKLTP